MLFKKRGVFTEEDAKKSWSGWAPIPRRRSS